MLDTYRKIVPAPLRIALRRILRGTDEQWQRVVMNRATEKYVRSLDLSNIDVLEISGKDWARLPFRSYRSVYFGEYDVCSGPLEREAWDLVIAEQVFEHVVAPWRAARNVFQMLRPGGQFLITTPFLIPIHEDPIDCSRWTETGLKHLLVEGGFQPDKITTDSWGNRSCLSGNLKFWTRYVPAIHSLKKEPRYPQTVWAFARK
jgi:SAM-dependent methyltransferase